jgi:hypothetical protein
MCLWPSDQMGPGGLIGVQRKVHASQDECFGFRMGRSLEVFDLGFGYFSYRIL